MALETWGCSLAAGEWVAFLDDDDECLPDRLERQLAYVSSHPDCEFLGGGVWRVTLQGKREYWGERETGRKTTREVLTRTAAMAQTILARKATLIRVGGFRSDLRRMEDFELGIRLAAAGVAPHYLAEPLCLLSAGARSGNGAVVQNADEPPGSCGQPPRVVRKGVRPSRGPTDVRACLP